MSSTKSNTMSSTNMSNTMNTTTSTSMNTTKSNTKSTAKNTAKSTTRKAREKSFYKSFDKDLRGRNGFQYEVGKTFEPDTKDQWYWLHFGEYVSSTLIHNNQDIRICEVKPLGQVNFYRTFADGYNKGEYNTDKLLIVRELSRDEIFEKLIEEKCNPGLFFKLKPPFEVLLRVKDRLNKWDKLGIIQRQDLTVKQKKQLLPKFYHRQIDRFEMMNSTKD